MKYEIGDKIIVLYSDEEGKVVDFINDEMVMIEVRGVRFPAYMDQIDFPYYKMFTKEKKVEEKKTVYIDQIKREKSISKKKVKDGVALSFVPILDKDIFDDDVVEKLKVYLVNNNEDDYNFKYSLFLGEESSFDLTSVVHKLSEFYLHDINFEDVSDNPRFEFEFSLSKFDKKKAPAFEVFKKLKGRQLFKKIEELHQKNEASFSYELFVSYPDKIADSGLDLSKLNNAGFKVYNAEKIKDNLPPARSVVDLHIEKLTDQPDKLSPREILDLQLSTFKYQLELAIAHHKNNIIFIHGIGEGRLKDAIHEELKLMKEVKTFVNQFHERYGFGATEVWL